HDGRRVELLDDDGTSEGRARSERLAIDDGAIHPPVPGEVHAPMRLATPGPRGSPAESGQAEAAHTTGSGQAEAAHTTRSGHAKRDDLDRRIRQRVGIEPAVSLVEALDDGIYCEPLFPRPRDLEPLMAVPPP